MNDNDFPIRMAGQALGLNLREGLKGGSAKELRRGFRADKMIPNSLQRDFARVDTGANCSEVIPENSCGVYDGTQPAVTFGL